MLWSRWRSTRLLVGAHDYLTFLSTHATTRYFSALFAATKNFPHIIGTAAAASTVMYGLSPLFLSFFATSLFTDPHSGLDLTSYLLFLALVGGAVNLFGACVLVVPDGRPALKTADEESEGSVNETTSLLSGKHGEVHVVAVQEPDELSLADLVKDPHFLVLFAFMVITVGCVSVSPSPIGRR
jgi:hypothetical protein